MSQPAPEWLIAEVRRAKRGTGTEMVTQTRDLLDRLHLPTVCDSASCPNRGECFSHHTATFLILGDVCTRGCAFCAVKKGKPLSLQADEPQRLARAVAELGLRHVVITSVTRDDLPDSGAVHYARVVAALRHLCPGVRVELLVPDFAGSREALATVLASGPDILAHNLETVPRLYPQVRRERIASFLKVWSRPSSFPQNHYQIRPDAGSGEESGSRAVLQDLRCGRDMLTIDNISPSSTMSRWPAMNPEFASRQRQALDLGFRAWPPGLECAVLTRRRSFGEIR
jgi:lipoic acid synthetase